MVACFIYRLKMNISTTMKKSKIREVFAGPDDTVEPFLMTSQGSGLYD